MAATTVLRIVGIQGFVKGEAWVLKPGEEAIIGRSRDCKICLRASKKYRSHREAQKEGLIADEAGAQLKEDHFRTVSGRHLYVKFLAEDEVKVEDLSRTGTHLDGKKLEGDTLLKDLAKKTHEVRLGTNETFRLELVRIEAAKKSSPKVSVKKKD